MTPRRPESEIHETGQEPRRVPDARHDRIVAGKYVEDSVLTARVKAALLKEPQLKALEVSVETLNGEVLRSGFVRDEERRPGP